MKLPLAVLALALAAFGGPPPAGAAADPCRLLTTGNVESVLHAKVLKRSPMPGSLSAGCQWQIAGSGLFTPFLSLQIHEGIDRAAFETYVKNGNAAGLHAKPVGGLGERAVDNGAQLVVLAKSQMLVVTLFGGKYSDAERARLKRGAAKRALTRL